MIITFIHYEFRYIKQSDAPCEHGECMATLNSHIYKVCKL